VNDYLGFCSSYDRWWHATGWPRKLALLKLQKEEGGVVTFQRRDTRPTDELLTQYPLYAAALWSAILLTLVFMIAVAVSEEKSDLPGKFPELSGQIVTITPEGSKSAVSDAENKKGLDAHDAKAVNGLIFAALGAFNGRASQRDRNDDRIGRRAVRSLRVRQSQRPERIALLSHRSLH
jgi:hypothetical protein